MIKAEVIHDSIANGKRISTLVCTYPRFIHAEFMTHRVFSRNASSSRAIPVAKLIAAAMERTVIPLHWGKNQKGMQADEEVSDSVKSLATTSWLMARDCAVAAAKELVDYGIHKQIANRLLEPFTTITVIVTATEWSNFFALRCHKDAEPHMRYLAEAMRESLASSSPVERLLHHPYHEDPLVSAARCARVSYLNHDGTEPSVDKDLVLAEMLRQSGHMSPFEHQARAFTDPDCAFGNFKGWIQYRKTLPNESR